MDPDDWFDRGFDKFCAFFEKLISRNIDQHWFRWLQWVLVTSALFAVWRKTEAIFVGIITIFSTLLLIFRAWVTALELLKTYLASLKGKSKIKFIPVIALFVLVSSCPVIVMYFVGRVFMGLIK